MAFETRLHDMHKKVEFLETVLNIKHILTTEVGSESDIDDQRDSYTELAKLIIGCSSALKQLNYEKERLESVNQRLQALGAELAAYSDDTSKLVEAVPMYMNALQLHNGAALDEANTGDDQQSTSKENKKVTSARKNSTSSSKSSTSAKKPTKKAAQIPYLTAAEFGSVPKYMKGRTLYSEANKAVDIVNQVAVAKYKIIYKTKGLTDYERRKKADYASQDGKESDGYCYITEDDIKEFASMKLDKHFLSLLTIVRHCGKMRQVRAGRLTKYLLVV